MVIAHDIGLLGDALGNEHPVEWVAMMKWQVSEKYSIFDRIV